ncbi:MAG: hypothetical protein OEY03_04385 [Rhizobacter sp.]|nr:hypothetical protein [Rhizobacter sp.]
MFGKMAAGDELMLMDGSYAGATTGTMHWDNGANSAQIPSGTANRPTIVRALNPGKVTIQGGLFVGRSTRKDSHIAVQGLTFEGGGELYNTSFVTIKDSGFHGSFGIGTNDHNNGNTDNLIEDVWVWAAKERIIAINYRAHRNVWRRVVVRGDGCGTADCTGSGNPNVGFTVYESQDVSVQNMLVVDRILAGSDEPYADFAVAQHTPGAQYALGRNEWLGTMSLRAPDTGYYMEPDVGGTVDKTIKISNAVAWEAPGGFNMARSGTSNVLENLTVFGRGDDAVRVAPELGSNGVLRNVVVQGTGRYALNTSYRADFVNVNGSWSSQTNQTTPTNVLAGNPLGGALKYLTRIEEGSSLKGKGAGGADVGANVIYRYGADGKRQGEAGYNTLGTTALWPWPNEARIKAEMCAATTRGFCSSGKRLDGVNPVTLTSYVWEALGNAVPAGIYP